MQGANMLALTYLLYSVNYTVVSISSFVHAWKAIKAWIFSHPGGTILLLVQCTGVVSHLTEDE